MILTKKYRLLFNYKGEVLNNNDYMRACNVEDEEKKIIGSVTEYYEQFAKGFEADNLSDLEMFIKQNNLIVHKDERFIEPTPFMQPWDVNYPDAKLRLFIYSNDSSLLAYEVPEFIPYIKSRNINLIFDAEMNGQFAYLTEIEPDDRQLLEYFGAKFEERTHNS
jgi:hypothetical protein